MPASSSSASSSFSRSRRSKPIGWGWDAAHIADRSPEQLRRAVASSPRVGPDAAGVARADASPSSLFDDGRPRLDVSHVHSGPSNAGIDPDGYGACLPRMARNSGRPAFGRLAPVVCSHDGRARGRLRPLRELDSDEATGGPSMSSRTRTGAGLDACPLGSLPSPSPN